MEVINLCIKIKKYKWKINYQKVKVKDKKDFKESKLMKKLFTIRRWLEEAKEK